MKSIQFELDGEMFDLVRIDLALALFGAEMGPTLGD